MPTENNQKVIDEKIKRILWDSIPHDFPKVTNAVSFSDQEDIDEIEKEPSKRMLS